MNKKRIAVILVVISTAAMVISVHVYHTKDPSLATLSGTLGLLGFIASLILAIRSSRGEWADFRDMPRHPLRLEEMILMRDGALGLLVTDFGPTCDTKRIDAQTRFYRYKGLKDVLPTPDRVRKGDCWIKLLPATDPGQVEDRIAFARKEEVHGARAA